MDTVTTQRFQPVRLRVLKRPDCP